MRRFVSITIVATLATCIVCFLPASGLVNAVELEGDGCQVVNSRAKAAMKLVHDAVAELGVRGQEAFADFPVAGTRWSDPELYVFVHDLEGNFVCNGPFPSVAGRNMHDFKDLVGKTVVRFMIELASNNERHGGWLHYLWPRPGETEAYWKSTYVRKAVVPDGSEYVVAAGVYDLPMEPCFAVQNVDDAVALMEREGEDAFPVIKSRTGPFLWRDTYVFVIGYDGVVRVAPNKPSLEGVHIQSLQSMDELNVLTTLLRTGTVGQGEWVEYLWPKLGYVVPSRKQTYVRRVSVGNKEYLVGCGVYLD